MAQQPLDARLNTLLGGGQSPSATPIDSLEPAPAEGQQQPIEDILSDPGAPAMDEPVQVAGLGLGLGKALRKAVTSQPAKATKNLVPDAARAAEGELPAAAKAGRFKLIPEADQTLTDQVGAAIDRRQKFSPLTGKPPEEAFNLNQFSDRDAAGVIAGVSDALGIQTKRVTFAEIKAKAAESGISESFLARLTSADGKMLPSAVETYKALEVLDASAGELDRLFKKVAEGLATDSDKLALRQQIALHGLIQKGVKGIQTETARALAVFRIPRSGQADVVRNVLEEFGGDRALADMAKSYLSLETRAAKNAMVEKSMFSSVKDVWFTTFINGLLSNPVTHAKNILGNMSFGLYQIPERAIASFYSNTLPQGVREWKALVPGSAQDKIALDEALTMVQSLRQGLSEGLELASTAFKKNQPSDLMSKIELQRNPQESMGETLQRMTGVDQDTWMGKALDYYGKAVTLPGRALMAEDEFFKGVMYRMELNTLVTRRAKATYRQAVNDGMSEADALAKAENDAVAMFQNPPADLDAAALEYAQRGTFQGKLPEGLEKLQMVFNHPALKVVVPFFKTPANIGLEVLERSPFAPLSSRFRDDVAKGGVYRDMALAKVTLGTTLMAVYASYAAEGKLTGRGPERKADREALLRQGWQPYSIKIGDAYYSYQGLEPVSALMAIASDYAEYAQREPDQGKVEQVFLGGAYGLYEYLKDQPYLQGVADIAKLIGSDQTGKVDGKKIMDGLAKQYGSFVIGGSPMPGTSSIVGGIERLIDPTIRDVRADPALPMGVKGFYEAMNQYRSRLPYFSEPLPESLNLWGDARQAGQSNPLEMLLPTRVSPAQFSEVDDKLVRMGSPIGMPPRKVDGVDLDAWQYNRLLTIYGKESGAKNALLDAMNSPGFDFMSLDMQQKFIQSVHSKFMQAAKNQLKMEDPGLQAKIDELTELRKANGLFYKPD